MNIKLKKSLTLAITAIVGTTSVLAQGFMDQVRPISPWGFWIGIAAFIAVLIGIAKVGRGNMKMALGVLGIVTVFFGYVAFFSGTATTQSAAATLTSTGAAQVAGCAQQTDGTNTINLAARNPLNSSLQYLAATTSIQEVGTGITLAAGTLTGGSSLSYVAHNVAPCKQAKLYVLGDSTTNIGAAIDVDSNSLTSDKEVVVPRTTTLQLSVYDLTLNAANESDSVGLGQDQRNLNTSNISMTTGDTATRLLDIELAGSAAGFGYYNGPDGVVFAADYSTQIFSVGDGLAITGNNIPVTKVVCTGDVTQGTQADACWTQRSFSSGDGTPRYTLKIHADLGDPTSTTDMLVYVGDRTYFRNADGKTTLGYFDSSSADVGQLNSRLQINFA